MPTASAIRYAVGINMRGSDMKELNDEIKLTINTMQSDIDDGAHGEMQKHLNSLLEIKRNELQQRLAERSWAEPVTHDQEPIKSVTLDGQVTTEAKQLTADELKASSWCVDSSEECLKAFVEKGLGAQYADWPIVEGYKYCSLAGAIVMMTPTQARNAALKQIHLIGNDFYWGEK